MDQQNEQTNPQPPNDHNPPQSDDANLRELALALIVARYPDATEGANDIEPQLLPGRLPPGFPGDFPFPPGSRVVGSLVATRPTVVVDTNQSSEAVIAFYTERLTAAGWTVPDDMPPRQGGFLQSGFGASGRGYAMFYRDDSPALQVMTYATPGGGATIHLSQLPEGVGPMRHGHRSRMHRDIFSVLPPIAPPLNTQQFQEGGSGGDDRVSSNARIESDLDLAALNAHYTAQLERGDWRRTDGGENGPVAWSTWTFESEDKEPWRALFVILKRPDVARRYWAHLLAEWAGEQPQGGAKVVSSVTGWYSYGQITRIPT